MRDFFSKFIAKTQAWIASKGGFSHIVAILFAGAVLAYAQVPAFHALALKIYAALPAWAEEVAAAVIGLYAWYRTASSPAGILAKARSINGNGNAPTAAEVDRADMAIK